MIIIKNTSLGGIFIGNFDFYYDDFQIEITIKIRFKTDKNLPLGTEESIRNRLFNGIEAYWNQPNYGLLKNGTDFIPIQIKIVEVLDNSAIHKVVKIHKSILITRGVEYVFNEVNLLPTSSPRTIAHEFGHVLGLKDEYPPVYLAYQWSLGKIFSTSKYLDDKKALMNDGTELRTRYFDNILKEVQKRDLGNNYEVSSN